LSAACIGVAGNFSVVKDFFGYRSGVYGHLSFEAIDATGFDGVPIDPSAPGKLSLRRQIELLQGPHIHLDLIRVGLEDFTTASEQEIDIAVQMTRELYSRIGLGVGRVLRFSIRKSKARGHTVLETEGETFDLIDEFEAHGGGMDVFFVRDMDFNVSGGTPSKNPGGCAVEMTGATMTGITLAHELAHFLGLPHMSVRTNLMSDVGFPKFPFDITSDQASTMRDSDHVFPGCP